MKRTKRLFFIMAFFLLVACGPQRPAVVAPIVTIDAGPTPNLALESVDLRVGYGASAGWLEVYFTDPLSPYRRQYAGGPDEILAAAIRDARSQVDVAAYSFNLWSLRDALLSAQRRGVRVRMVMESSNLDDEVPQELLAAGIPIVGDERDGLMHDKFVVIDGVDVWLGSMNFTVAGAYYNANNLLHIRSVQMAENYTSEFEEMFLARQFGPEAFAKTPNPSLNLNGVQMEVYFSPDDGVSQALLPLLEDAQESIYFLAFSFTSDELGQAVRQAAARGVQVRGVMDSGQINSNTGTEYDAFRQADLDVRRDGLDGMMHHKVFIIDREIVVTGSYNFSRSAETRNDENLLIIYSPQVASWFIDEFWRVYEHSVQE